MKLEQIKGLLDKVTLVEWNGKKYMGIFSEGAIDYAVSIGTNNFMPRKWLAALYTDEATTVTLSVNADVASTPFDPVQMEELKHRFFQLERAEVEAIPNLVVSRFMNN